MKAKVILATILILAASCVKNEVREVSMHGDGQILYNPAPLKTITKAGSVSDFPLTSTFGSCAWYLPGDNKWDDHYAASAPEVVPTLYIPETEISYNGDSKSGVWRNKDKSYYWPMNGSLTFISWAPYDLGKDAGKKTTLNVTRENGFEITGWTMDSKPGYGIVSPTSGSGVATTDPDVDILLSYTKDCTRNTANGKVPTKFSHLLCKVKVVATLAKQLGEGEKPWEVISVTLSDIYTKADYSTYVKDGSNKITLSKLWRNQSDRRSYVYAPETSVSVNYGEGGIGTGAVIFPETLFMPQFLTEREKGTTATLPMITIECKNGKGESEILNVLLFNKKNASSLSVWNQGKSITYVVTLGDEDTYIDFKAEVEEENDWTYSGNDFNVGVGEIINGK